MVKEGVAGGRRLKCTTPCPAFDDEGAKGVGGMARGRLAM